MSGTPELHEHDPRLCPGDGSDWDELEEGAPRPPYWPPEPFTKPHSWQGGGDIRGTRIPRYCRWCEVTDDAVRERFSNWRYEQVIEGLTKAVETLTQVIELR